MPQATATHAPNAPPAGGCCDVGDFIRLRYFHGRPLSALDLRREQAYLLDKARLRNRLLHGWGIVCGLEVEVADPEPEDPCDTSRPPAVVIVHPGAAIDCNGNEIVVRHPRRVVVDALLDEHQRKALSAEPGAVYLSLCYHEELIEPTRPLLAAECEPVPTCQYGRVCETYRICAWTTRPDPGPACEPCCGACEHPCLELVAMQDFDPEKTLTAGQLDVSGRRALALHELAEIVAVNWFHGATYTREGATALLADGIEVRFSRPVQVASLHEHVIELVGIDAGGGRSAGMYAIEGEFVGLAAGGLTDRFVFRSTTDETLQYGDRVAIRIHGDLILDECCRAVDANHIGGRIPVLDQRPAEPVDALEGPDCPPRPSGNGTEGGEFVSWILVQERSGKR